MEFQRLIPFPVLFKIANSLHKTVYETLKRDFPEIDRILLVSDAKGARKYGELLIDIPGICCVEFIDGGTIEHVIRVEEIIKKNKVEFIIGLGGGRVLDTVKLASSRTFVSFLLVPTSLSHDGILSPVAVIDFEDEIKSIVAVAPAGVIVDISIISSAPGVLQLAGCGDLISNLSAVEDWQLASVHKGEKIDYFALMLSKSGAKNILYSDAEPFSEVFFKDLAEGLAASGLSMIISGNSRPASGAEHLISHALDLLLRGKNPHGIQVGIATLFTQKLRGMKVEHIKRFYDRIGFPKSPMDIGVSKELFFEAIKMAPFTRKGRFTILDLNPAEDELKRAFEVYLE